MSEHTLGMKAAIAILGDSFNQQNAEELAEIIDRESLPIIAERNSLRKALEHAETAMRSWQKNLEFRKFLVATSNTESFCEAWKTVETALTRAKEGQ